MTAETVANLRAAPTVVLLQAAYSLTHRVHILSEVADDPTQASDRRALAREHREDTRAERALIDAEIVRRAGS